MVLDAKIAKSFKWDSAIVLHDETFGKFCILTHYNLLYSPFHLPGRDMISRVILSLSQESPDGIVTPTAISMFKISSKNHEWDRKKDIRLTLKALPVSRIGTNFIAIVTTKVMETIIEISRDIGLVNTFTQWLYVVSDTSFGNNNVSSIAPMIDEGHNVAFMFNNTRSESTCVVIYRDLFIISVRYVRCFNILLLFNRVAYNVTAQNSCGRLYLACRR